jgi:hypothetical protein
MKSLNLGLSCFTRVGRVGSGRTKGHTDCEVFGFRQPFFEAPTKSRWLIAISQEVFYFPPTKSPDNGSLSARGRQIENMRPGTSLFIWVQSKAGSQPSSPERSSGARRVLRKLSGSETSSTVGSAKGSSQSRSRSSSESEVVTSRQKFEHSRIVRGETSRPINDAKSSCVGD